MPEQSITLDPLYKNLKHNNMLIDSKKASEQLNKLQTKNKGLIRKIVTPFLLTTILACKLMGIYFATNWFNFNIESVNSLFSLALVISLLTISTFFWFHNKVDKLIGCSLSFTTIGLALLFGVTQTELSIWWYNLYYGVLVLLLVALCQQPQFSIKLVPLRQSLLLSIFVLTGVFCIGFNSLATYHSWLQNTVLSLWLVIMLFEYSTAKSPIKDKKVQLSILGISVLILATTPAIMFSICLAVFAHRIHDKYLAIAALGMLTIAFAELFYGFSASFITTEIFVVIIGVAMLTARVLMYRNKWDQS